MAIENNQLSLFQVEAGNSTQFIEFMLKIINEAVDAMMESQKTTQENLTDTQMKILELMKEKQYITRNELAEKIGITPDGIKYHLDLLRKKESKFTATRSKNKIEKLVKFYEKNGFERIEDTQYLVKNMDFR